MRQDNHAAMVSNDHTFPVSHPRFVRVAHGGATKHILSRMRGTGRVGNTSPNEGMQ